MTTGSSTPTAGASATVTEPPPTQSDVSGETVPAVDVYLKILSPVNKKEFRMYTLRGLRKEDIDCLTQHHSVVIAWC